MFSKKDLLIIIFINTLLVSSCSIQDQNHDISNIQKHTESEIKSYNVNLEDISKIQGSLNVFLTSTINQENHIDILNGKYIYDDSNQLIYVFLYDLYKFNSELKVSGNIGFATTSRITCINLINENPDFAFTEDNLIEFLENDKQSNKSNLNSIRFKTMCLC